MDWGLLRGMMELERNTSEPCLSPAAFVDQVQYSNILEGRFKQLQGKSRAAFPSNMGTSAFIT